MRRLIRKFKNLKPKNEDWVSIVLKRRQFRPILTTIIIVISIFSYAAYNSYSNYNNKLQKEIILKKRLTKYKKILIDINKKITNIENEISDMQNLGVNSKKSIDFLNKVCQLLKKREVIGSFYIIKKQNTKYANVLDIEIQVSYGDKELLFLVTKIVLEKVFFLKNIEQTKIGLKAQIFKPSEENK